MKIHTNLLSGIIFGILSLTMILIVPREIQVPTFDNGGPSPRIIPYLVLIGIFLCSLGLIIQSLLLKKEKIVHYNIKLEKASVVSLLVMILFGTVMVKFGFIMSVLVVLPIMVYSLGERKIFVYIVTMAAGVGVYFLFTKIFNISLPVFGGI